MGASPKIVRFTVLIGAIAVATFIAMFAARSMTTGVGGLEVQAGGGSGTSSGIDIEGFAEGSGKRLVVVHAEWCGHCTQLLKDGGVWDQVKDKLPGITIDQIDEADSPEVVKRMNVTSFPDIRVLDGDTPIAQFQGERDVDSIVEFAMNHVK